MYYTSIPVVTERSTTRHWDANKLREFRKRIDSGICSLEEIDEVALSLMDGELVELASDWLGNTVRPSRLNVVYPSHIVHRSSKSSLRGALWAHESACSNAWPLTLP